MRAKKAEAAAISKKLATSVKQVWFSSTQTQTQTQTQTHRYRHRHKHTHTHTRTDTDTDTHSRMWPCLSACCRECADPKNIYHITNDMYVEVTSETA